MAGLKATQMHEQHFRATKEHLQPLIWQHKIPSVFALCNLPRQTNNMIPDHVITEQTYNCLVRERGL